MTHLEIAEELAGKMVGDTVAVEDGMHALNVFEYHVENGRLIAKFNAESDDKQLNFDGILFPEEVAVH